MTKRKTILVFIDWFLPGTNAGGPVRSVASVVKLLHPAFNFKIFTRNTDHNSTAPYAGIVPDTWVRFDEGTEVYYCSAEKLSKNTIARILQTTECHKIYINSFYSPWFSIYPLQVIKQLNLRHKVVLAPRGMLGKGALTIKPLKKKMFINYARLTGLHKNISWQASSAEEAKDIEAAFGKKARVHIAGNLSYIDQLPFAPKAKEINALRLFFLSRVVPIKNLHAALEALAKLPQGISVVYDIYGPPEDENYRKQCSDIIAKLPAHIQVNYRGAIANEAVQQTLQSYHALYMPTLNENFGHAILESFGAGCLALISDQTPWNGLAEKQIGYNVAVFEPGAITQMQEALTALAAMPADVFNHRSQQAHAFAAQYLAGSENTAAFTRLFDGK